MGLASQSGWNWKLSRPRKAQGADLRVGQPDREFMRHGVQSPRSSNPQARQAAAVHHPWRRSPQHLLQAHGGLAGQLNHETHADAGRHPGRRDLAWLFLQSLTRNFLIATAETFAIGRAAVPQFVRASVSNASNNDALLLAGFQALADALRQDGGPAEE